MKLVLYGGGHHDETESLDRKLIELAASTSSKITFIPSCSYDSDIDFQDFVIRFSSIGIKRFINFPVDAPYDDVLIKEAFTSDIIYLDGGNTYYFLNTLRKYKFIPRLKKYVKDGGVLAGLSAGAILMTPNIETAGFPPFDCDLNDEKLRNFNSLNLVPFEFFPHYRNSKRYNESLLNHSISSPYNIFACADGAGIIIDNGKMTIEKQLTVFYQGKKYARKRRVDELDLFST